MLKLVQELFLIFTSVLFIVDPLTAVQKETPVEKEEGIEKEDARPTSRISRSPRRPWSSAASARRGCASSRG